MHVIDVLCVPLLVHSFIRQFLIGDCSQTDVHLHVHSVFTYMYEFTNTSALVQLCEVKVSVTVLLFGACVCILKTITHYVRLCQRVMNFLC